MSDSVLSTLPVTGNKKQPLPLIVAEKWDFPLAYVETENGFYYAVQDWIKGLTGSDQPHKVWDAVQRANPQLSFSKRQLPYTAANGKTYQIDHTDEKGLFLVAQYLRVTKARPQLDAIKKFLAAAGAFVDQVRRDPNAIITSGALTPEQAMDMAIEGFHAEGRDDKWIRARVEGKIQRNLFTRALSAAVAEELGPRHYATATDDVYKGLWERTAAQLKKQLSVPKNGSLRDHQPTLALDYQRIAEEVCAQKLGERQEVEFNEARTIVQTVAQFIGQQAAATSKLLGMDLATGKPLLE